MQEGTPIQDQPSQAWRFARGLIFLALAGGFLVALSSVSRHHPTAITSVLGGFNLKTAAPTTLKLGTTNEYSEKDGGSPGQFYPWLKGNLLAEPYRPTVFKVLNYDPSKEYEWELYSEETNNLEQTFTGHEFVHTFEREDVWSDKYLVVNEFETTDKTGDSTRRLSSSVYVKLYVRYVRREIRNLFDEERDAVLDTMALHWTVGQEDGEKLYGSNYKSMQTLLQYHLSAAADMECDHYHDGYGFLQQHSALTILFEQSMQAVNPSFALPYWDYIFDFEEFENEHGGEYSNFNNGALFNEHYFGGTDDDNHVMNGRWARLTMPTLDDVSEEEAASLPHNAFNILRSPWSNNADPLAVRGSESCGCSFSYGEVNLPTCAGLGSLTAKASFVGWYDLASYSPHGPAHLLLGGLYGCSDAFDELGVLMTENGIDTQQNDVWKLALSVYSKSMWREGLLDCSSTDVGGCKCINYDDLVAQDVSYLKTYVDDILDDDAVRGLNMADSVYQKFFEILCNTPLWMGENLQSSSSYMPEFWPLHGNVERMYQLRRLKGPWEGGFDWSVQSWVFNQENGVKNWQTSCYGHGEDDPVLLGVDNIMVKGKKTVLNIQEYLSILEPANMVNLDYIYDSVEWTYCTEQSLTLP